MYVCFEIIIKKPNNQTYAEYWRGLASVYPTLPQIAKDFGTMLSTSVLSESVFSGADIVITKRNKWMDPKIIGMIMSLRS